MKLRRNILYSIILITEVSGFTTSYIGQTKRSIPCHPLQFLKEYKASSSTNNHNVQDKNQIQQNSAQRLSLMIISQETKQSALYSKLKFILIKLESMKSVKKLSFQQQILQKCLVAHKITFNFGFSHVSSLYKLTEDLIIFWQLIKLLSLSLSKTLFFMFNYCSALNKNLQILYKIIII